MKPQKKSPPCNGRLGNFVLRDIMNCLTKLLADFNNDVKRLNQGVK